MLTKWGLVNPSRPPYPASFPATSRVSTSHCGSRPEPESAGHLDCPRVDKGPSHAWFQFAVRNWDITLPRHRGRHLVPFNLVVDAALVLREELARICSDRVSPVSPNNWAASSLANIGRAAAPSRTFPTRGRSSPPSRQALIILRLVSGGAAAATPVPGREPPRPRRCGGTCGPNRLLGRPGSRMPGRSSERHRRSDRPR